MKSYKNNILILMIIFVISIGVIYLAKSPLDFSFKKEKLLWQCNISDLQGDLLRKYPCEQCLYSDDGEIVMRCNNDRLSYFSVRGELKWEVPLHIHHSFNWNESQTEILALSSEVVSEQYEKVRYDVLITLDKNGKVTRRFSFWENKKATEKEMLQDPVSIEFIGRFDDNFLSDIPARIEATHANSFYEIADNDLKDVHVAFAPGNFIVNVNHMRRIFIFDNKLKNILLSMRLPYKHNIHDAQITPAGTLLVFNNRPFENDKRASIEEWDLLKKRLIRRYLGDEKNPFISASQGGVRLLRDKKIVFSDNSGNVFYLDSDMNLIRKLTVDFKGKNLQGIDVRDVSKFLRNNKMF